MNIKEIDLFEKFKCRLNKELYDMVFINPQKVVLIGEENLIELFSNIYKSKGGIIEYVYGYKINDIKNDIFSIYNVIDNTINKINKNTPLIILGAYYTSFFIQLKSMGFNNIFSFLTEDISNIDNYFRMVEHKDKIMKMYNLLEDLTSKKVIENVFMARIYDDLRYIGDIQDRNLDNEYFDKNIIKLLDNEIFIDAGAYNGDTLYNFLKNTNSHFKDAYLFEPDRNNFTMLDNQLSNKLLVSNIGEKLDFIELGETTDNIHIYNSGVYSKASKLNFTGNLSKASHITGNLNMSLNNRSFSDDIIDVVRLDDVLEDKEVTYIKMDIEGSEYEAIKGARKIITRCKPKLAICIYHNENHLWDIPILINDLNPNYKIYIRHYNSNLWDTICYAI